MKRLLSNTIIQIVLSITIGILLGNVGSAALIRWILPVKHILGQLIFFMVPLIILGFVTPSITRLRSHASRLLGIALSLAYFSSVGSGLFGALLGYRILPMLEIRQTAGSAKALPELFFRLDIPPIMSVMSALILALLIGLAVGWTRSRLWKKILDDFQQIVLALVNRVLIPLLPVFIGANFAVLAYEGALGSQLPVFLSIILIVIAGHFLWLALLYGMAGLYARKNPLDVLRYYPPAYLTALGTMSSAATLAVALRCAKKSPLLRDEVTDFSIPLLANIHLCGSVLTEVFFVMAVSLVLYGALPAFPVLLLFILLLGIFAIGAPGVPGGTVMASLGLIISVLGFDEAGTALMLTIFALQDSFGTACNVTGDGALSLILSASEDRREKRT